eukprot:2714169-Karenia_brevis.AAC.1
MELREVVAENFNHFREQVVDFTKREGRQPSRHSKADEERQLGEQVYNCFRGKRKLEHGQLEELRACLGQGGADRTASSVSRKRKTDSA